MEAIYEPRQLKLDDLNHDVVGVIMDLMPLRDQLSLAVSSKTYLNLLLKFIVKSTRPDNRSYLQKMLQLHASRGDLIEYIEQVKPNFQYQHDDTFSMTTLITIGKFLSSDRFEPDLFKRLLLLATDEQATAEILRCLTPYFLSMKNRSDLCNSLHKIYDKSTNYKKLEQLLALTSWLTDYDQHRIVKYADEFSSRHQLISGNRSILPFWLMEVKNSHINSFNYLVKSLAKDRLRDSIKKEEIRAQLLIYMQDLKLLIPYLGLDNAVDLRNSILLMVGMCFSGMTLNRRGQRFPHLEYYNLADLSFQVLDRLNTYLEYRFSYHPTENVASYSHLMEAVEGHKVDMHHKLAKSGYDLLLALDNRDDDFDCLSAADQIVNDMAKLRTRLFHLAKEKKLPNDKNYKPLTFLDENTTEDILFEKFQSLLRDRLINLANTDNIKTLARVYFLLTKLNLMDTQEALTRLKIGDDKVHGWIKEFDSSDKKLYRLKLQEILLNLFPRTNLKTKEVILMTLWKKDLDNNIKNLLIPLLSDKRMLSAELSSGVIESLLANAKDNEVMNKMRSNIQLRGLICNQFNMPFHKTLIFLTNLSDPNKIHTQDSIAFDLRQILKPSMEQRPVNAGLIFNILDSVFAFIEEEIAKDKLAYPYGSRLNSSEFRNQLRLAVLNLVDDITPKISNANDKMTFLERLRGHPVLSQHISSNFFHKIGRSGGQIAMDKKINELEVSKGPKK